MARSSSRSSVGSRRSAFARPAPTPMPMRAAPAPSRPQQANHTSNATPKPAAQNTATAAPSASSGLLGTLAASAAGSVAGHWISSKMFGGESQGLMPQTQHAIDSEFGACSQPLQSFLSCVESNSQDIGSCQWVYSQFSECRDKQVA